MKIEFSIQVYNNFRSGRAALPPPIVQNSFFNFYEKALQTNLTAPSFLTLVLTNLFVPYAIWAWLYAFVTLQHHTHPNVPWFDKRTEWNFFNAQVRASVHVVLPRIIEILFLNVLEHTAHHVDSKIPLYKLRESQKALEKAFAEQITVHATSLRQFHNTMKICKLSNRPYAE